MLSNQLLLDDASGDEVTYNLISQDGTGTIRHDIASTVSEPRRLSIKHTVQGAGADAIDRHLVSSTHTLLSATGKPRTCIVNTTIAVPRDTVITDTVVNDLVANQIDLLSDGGFSGSGLAGTTNLAAIKRGES
jgi:hypothetical protein